MNKVLLMLWVGLAFSGCANAAFIRGVDAGVSTIGPEYRKYVETDAKLDAESKVLRLRTLDELIKLVGEAKK